MYQRFLGLRESPFGADPDPCSLFLTRQTEEALAAPTDLIQNRKGLVLRTGEVGTGKARTKWLSQSGVVPFPIIERKR